LSQLFPLAAGATILIGEVFRNPTRGQRRPLQRAAR
jgi:hypothetical protein